MTAGRTAARLRRTCLDSGDATALLDERRGMIEQLIGVGNIFDIQQLHQRVALGIKIPIHIFQHGLDTILLAIADRPHAIELQAFAHGTLKDKDRRSTRTRDKVNALGIEMGNGTGEDGVMPAGEQSDAVGTYQRTAVLVADIQYTLLEQGALVGLLTKTC